MTILLSMELSLLAVLKSSQIFFFITEVILSIKSGFIYLNGTPTTNMHAQIYTGDCIQIMLTLKYTMNTFLQFNTLLLLQKNKLVSLINSFKCNSFNRNNSCNFNDIFFKNGNIGFFDIPNFLEVDYMTGTIFLLYTPFFF
jgi:hypothetical protein